MRLILPNIGPRILNPSFGPNRGLLQRFISSRGIVGGAIWHNLASAGTYLTYSNIASGEGWVGTQTPGGNPSLRLQDTATPWSQLAYTGPTAVSTSWTMAAWVRPSSAHPSGSARADVITKHGSAALQLRVSTGTLRMSSFLPTSATSSFALTYGVWQRLVYTCDGTNTRFYVNGSLKDTFAGSTGISQATTVGQYTGSQGNALWADIDDVCFANRSWGAGDVAADYQDGTNGYMRGFLPDPSRMIMDAAAASAVRSYRPWFGAQTRSL